MTISEIHKLFEGLIERGYGTIPVRIQIRDRGGEITDISASSFGGACVMLYASPAEVPLSDKIESISHSLEAIYKRN